MDEANDAWMFKEGDLFVLPVDARPVKIAMHVDVYTAEVAQPHGGMEWSSQNRIMGCWYRILQQHRYLQRQL